MALCLTSEAQAFRSGFDQAQRSLRKASAVVLIDDPVSSVRSPASALHRDGCRRLPPHYQGREPQLQPGWRPVPGAKDGNQKRIDAIHARIGRGVKACPSAVLGLALSCLVRTGLT